MTLTPLLQRAVEQEGAGDFIQLLEDFGRWARPFYTKGWHSGLTYAQPALVDDESARLLDIALGIVKRRRPLIFDLLRMHFINSLDEHQICRVLNRGRAREPRGGVQRGQGFYRVDLSQLGMQTQITERVVTQLVNVGVEHWREALREMSGQKI